MGIRFLRIWLFCSVFWVTEPVGATLWVVDGAGGGTHTGIQEAVQAALPGDVIEVWDGDYPEAVVLDKSGLTLRGDGSYPRINPPLMAGQVIEVAESNLTIRGLEIYNPLGPSNLVDGIWDGVYADGPGGIRIEDCVIHDLDGGIRLYGPDLTIADCDFYAIWTAGIHVSGDGVGARADVRGNWLHDWARQEMYCAGIQLQNDRHGEVSYNYIEGMRLGIAVYYGGPTTGLLDIAHNTIAQAPNTNLSRLSYGIAFQGGGEQIEGARVVIRDNVISGARGYGIWKGGGVIQGSMLIANNLFYSNNLIWPQYTNQFEWFGDETRPAVGWDGDFAALTFSNNITALDPLWAGVNPAPEGYYRLRSGSPALGAASDRGTRSVGRGDVGAWQFSETRITACAGALGNEVEVAIEGLTVDYTNRLQRAATPTGGWTTVTGFWATGVATNLMFNEGEAPVYYRVVSE